MMMELTKFIAGVNNPYYKQVLTKLFIDNTEFAEAFKKHSAAKSVHHGFIGGCLNTHYQLQRCVISLQNNILF